MTPYWQWLAGLVDGDGHLAVTGVGGPQLCLAGNRHGISLLERARALLGRPSGALVPQSSHGGVVYRETHSHLLRRFVERVGPFLRHSGRLAQLREVCRRLGEPVPVSVPLGENQG